jgi:hypothetical protein
MGDTIIKGVKRATVPPTSRRTSATTVAKSRALAGKSARLKPIVKKAKSEKAPVKKATKVKAVTASKNRPTKASSKKAPITKKANTKAIKTTKPLKTKVVSKSKVIKKLSNTRKTVVAKPKKFVSKRTAPVSTKPKAISKIKPIVKVKKAAKTKRVAKVKQLVKVKAAVKPVAVKKAAFKPVKKALKTVLPTPRKPEIVNHSTPKQPNPNEAAALKAFEKAHKEFVRGRFADARDSFKHLLEKHAGVVEVAARARTYLAIAESRLKAEASLPKDADSLYDLGVVQLNRGDYNTAQEFFERAIKRDPNAAHIHYGLAATRARLGALESALELLQRAFDLQPNLRFRAQQDPDLTSLRENPEFEHLVSTTRF